MKKAILAAAVIAALSAALGFAQAPADDPHHPAAPGTPQATSPAGQATAGGQEGMMGNIPMMNMMPMVGGGPAGMSAAVYAESEGLRTVLIEPTALVVSGVTSMACSFGSCDGARAA